MTQATLTPTFVESVPENLEEGTLYVSTRFRTASHLCACGCGLKVVTPIKPAKWRFTYDGETVSLAPSIGSWQLPCQSHYWITRNEIRWARAFSGEEIEEVMLKDAADAKKYWAARATPEATDQSVPSVLSKRRQRASWFDRLRHTLRR